MCLDRSGPPALSNFAELCDFGVLLSRISYSDSERVVVHNFHINPPVLGYPLELFLEPFLISIPTYHSSTPSITHGHPRSPSFVHLRD
jgi:hypothetical protein